MHTQDASKPQKLMLVQGHIVPEQLCIYRYFIVLFLSVRHVVYRLLHLAKRFGPKGAFFSCKRGYKTHHDVYHVSYAQKKNHQVPIYRRCNESLLFQLCICECSTQQAAHHSWFFGDSSCVDCWCVWILSIITAGNLMARTPINCSLRTD